MQLIHVDVLPDETKTKALTWFFNFYICGRLMVHITKVIE